MSIEFINSNYTIQEKLQILADAAKYDVACTSSGSSRRGKKGELGNAEACGICHSFAADGRCISLLKILMTNHCAYDCKYCINRASNDVKRATFTPEEICELTIEFYKRNYIEGLFLSSGVLKNPSYTMEKMCETLLLLRTKYHFNGYIHVKTIPGASDELLAAAGYLADRISVNLELPTEAGLRTLAPNKTMQIILNPMGKVQSTIASHRMAIGKTAHMERSLGNRYLDHGIFSANSRQRFRNTVSEEPPLVSLLENELPFSLKNGKRPASEYVLGWENATQLAPRDMSKLKRSFAPAGQSTQMIIGATGESDYTLLQTTQALYQGFDLKRVFYSAYIPLNEEAVLPQIGTPPPLLREHRLYQDQFSVEVETADYAVLLRVPGIGPKSAGRIVNARRYGRLDFPSLKKMGVVLKRAHYFITCQGKQMYHTPIEENYIIRQLVHTDKKELWETQHANESFSQMTLADFGIR